MSSLMLSSVASKKGRISLSISQEILDRLETYKGSVNLSAETEQMFRSLLDRLENQAWVKRNEAALVAHGRAIVDTGLAGQEFERI